MSRDLRPKTVFVGRTVSHGESFRRLRTRITIRSRLFRLGGAVESLKISSGVLKKRPSSSLTLPFGSCHQRMRSDRSIDRQNAVEMINFVLEQF